MSQFSEPASLRVKSPDFKIVSDIAGEGNGVVSTGSRLVMGHQHKVLGSIPVISRTMLQDSFAKTKQAWDWSG